MSRICASLIDTQLVPPLRL